PGEHRQLARQIGGAVGRGCRVCKPSLPLLHRLRARGEIEIAEYRHEQVVEVVRDSTRELTDGFELRRTLELVVRTLAVRDVHYAAQQRAHLARLILDHGALAENPAYRAIRQQDAVLQVLVSSHLDGG